MKNHVLIALAGLIMAGPLLVKAAEEPPTRGWVLRFDKSTVEAVLKDRGMTPDEFTVRVTARVGELYGDRAFRFVPQWGGETPADVSVIDLIGYGPPVLGHLPLGQAPYIDDGDKWLDILSGPTYGVFIAACADGLDHTLNRRAEAHELVSFVAVVTAHEIGHAVGLPHLFPAQPDVMMPGIFLLQHPETGHRLLQEQLFRLVSGIYLDWLDRQVPPTKHRTESVKPAVPPRCGCKIHVKELK